MAQPKPLDPNNPAAWVLEEFSSRLTKSLQAMTGERPDVEVADPVPPDSAAAGEIFWWEQPLTLAPLSTIWVGAPESSWMAVGTRALQSAGIEEVEAAEARSTYQEILQQTLSGLAQGLTQICRTEVLCGIGHQEPEAPVDFVYPLLILSEKEAPWSVLVAFSQPLLTNLVRKASPKQSNQEPAAAAAGPAAPGGPAAPAARLPSEAPPVGSSQTLDLLLDVELPVSISFGRSHMALKEVLKLSSGSIVELNRAVTEPVEIILNNCVIARGEVVVVEGNYGVRINQIISRQERLRTLH